MSQIFAVFGVILSTYVLGRYVCMFAFEMKSSEDRSEIVLSEIKRRYSSISYKSTGGPAELHIRHLNDDSLLTEQKIIEKELKVKETTTRELTSIASLNNTV